MATPFPSTRSLPSEARPDCSHSPSSQQVPPLFPRSLLPWGCTAYMKRALSLTDPSHLSFLQGAHVNSSSSSSLPGVSVSTATDSSALHYTQCCCLECTPNLSYDITYNLSLGPYKLFIVCHKNQINSKIYRIKNKNIDTFQIYKHFQKSGF